MVTLHYFWSTYNSIAVHLIHHWTKMYVSSSWSMLVSKKVKEGSLQLDRIYLWLTRRKKFHEKKHYTSSHERDNLDLLEVAAAAAAVVEVVETENQEKIFWTMPGNAPPKLQANMMKKARSGGIFSSWKNRFFILEKGIITYHEKVRYWSIRHYVHSCSHLCIHTVVCSNRIPWRIQERRNGS